MGLTFEHRLALRQRVSAARRAALTTTCPNGWGSQSGYRRGCRCPDCKFATTTARQQRRKRAA